MVAGTCPHCNQRLGFSSPKPGIYECPFCSNKFKIGTTNSKSTPKNTKPKKERGNTTQKEVGKIEEKVTKKQRMGSGNQAKT